MHKRCVPRKNAYMERQDQIVTMWQEVLRGNHIEAVCQVVASGLNEEAILSQDISDFSPRVFNSS